MLKVLILSFSLIASLIAGGYRVNFTNSMPVGVYQKLSKKRVERDDLVGVCLEDVLANYAKSRNIVEQGSCPSGLTPLLKKVIAIPGDIIFVDHYSLIVNGKIFYAPHQKSREWNLLNHAIKANGYWVYGSNNTLHSWDSRYFGGIKQRQIIGIYKPVLVIGVANRIRHAIHHAKKNQEKGIL